MKIFPKLEAQISCRQPSVAEKKAIALVLSKEEEAKRSLAQCYGVLVLGLGLEDAHHMHCGRCVLLPVKTFMKTVSDKKASSQKIVLK